MIALALDAILVIVLFEAVALAVYHRRTGRGIAPRAVLANLAAGFFLMLTARLALAPEPNAGLLAATLLFALIAHLADLATRWR